MHLWSILLFSFALSVDSASVGLTYGLRNVIIPIRTRIIIAFCAGSILFLSMMLGSFMAHILNPEIATKLGGIILIGLGLYILYSFVTNKEKDVSEKTKEIVSLMNLEIQSLGIVVQILRKPTDADFDRSGTISGIEALFLGIALSVDSFGAGLAASLLGVSPLLLAISTSIMSFIFLSVGVVLGKRFSTIYWIDKLMFVPGLVLITIGLLKL